MSTVKIVVAIVLSAVVLFAEMPTEQLSKSSMGISYDLHLNGFSDGSSDLAGQMHTAGLHYAPIPYFSIGLQLGVGKSSISNGVSLQRSDPAFSVGGGLNLFTPEFARVLTFTGGSNASMLQGNYQNSSLSALVLKSHVGLIVEVLSILDLELGYLHNYFKGTTGFIGFVAEDFENKDQHGGYVQLTLHDPESGAFLLLNSGITPEMNADSEGIYNGTVGVSIGTVLRHKRRAHFSRD